MQGQRTLVKNTKGLGMVALYKYPGAKRMPLSPQGKESFSVLEVAEKEAGGKLKDGWSRTREEAIEKHEEDKAKQAKKK